MHIGPLTPDEYRNSIYLDFEGEGKKKDGTVPKPHMAGIFRPNEKGGGGKYCCSFFRQEWKPASNGIPCATYIAFNDFFEELTKELEKNKSHLVYWTIHEELVLEYFLSDSIFKKLRPYLYNLHPLARRYVNRTRKFGKGVSAKGKTLENIFAAIYAKRHPYPPFPLGAAEACRRIDIACTKNKKWKYFTYKQKAYVKDLVNYNEGDCRSTWLIAKRVGNYFS